MNAVLYRNDSDHLNLVLHSGGGVNGYCLIDDWKPFASATTHAGSYGSSVANWLPLRAIPDLAMGPVKNQCVNLQGAMRGEVLCGSSDEGPIVDTSHFAMTDQSFTNWSYSNNIYVPRSIATSDCNSIIQPLLFEPDRFADGEVYALFRTSTCNITAQVWWWFVVCVFMNACLLTNR
jgi:hypothetical protein